MIIDEQVIRLDREHLCTVCMEKIPVGQQAKLTVNYHKGSKQVSYSYVCERCSTVLNREQVTIPRAEEAYKEYCESCQ